MADRKYEYKLAWKVDDRELVGHATQLWQKHKILPQDVSPSERASEICALAYFENEPVGVSTAVVRKFNQVRSNIAFLRAFIAPDHREHSIGRDLAVVSKGYLSEWSESNPELEVRGMATVIQSSIIRKMPLYGLPVWRQSKLALMGYTDDDDQIRLTWFDHIMIPADVT